MRLLKFIGDRHDEVTAITALRLALPTFKKYGYNTIFLELPYPGANIDKLIEYREDIIQIYRQFPKGEIPKNMTPEQQVLFNKLRTYQMCDEDVAKAVKVTFEHEERFQASHEIYIEVLRELKRLEMRVVPIDLDYPLEYQHGSRVEERNRYMFNAIKNNSDDKTKGVVFVGFAHIIDTWQNCFFNYGIFSMVKKDLDGVFDSQNLKIYFPYRQKDKIHEDTKKALMTCNQDITCSTEFFDLPGNNEQDYEKFLQRLENDLNKENLESLNRDNNSMRYSRYYVPLQSSETEDLQTIKYIESLGGFVERTFKKAQPYPRGLFLCRMPINSLHSIHIREILRIDRVTMPKGQISNVTNEYLDYLKKCIQPLTAEEETQPDGTSHYIFTFPDDSVFKGQSILYITNREYIDAAKFALLYRPAIQNIQSKAPQFFWRFHISPMDGKPIAISDKYFYNKDVALIELRKIVKDLSQAQLIQWSLHNRKIAWIIIITDLNSLHPYVAEQLDESMANTLNPELSASRGLTTTTQTTNSNANPTAKIGPSVTASGNAHRTFPGSGDLFTPQMNVGNLETGESRCYWCVDTKNKKLVIGYENFGKFLNDVQEKHPKIGINIFSAKKEAKENLKKKFAEKSVKNGGICRAYIIELCITKEACVNLCASKAYATVEEKVRNIEAYVRDETQVMRLEKKDPKSAVVENSDHEKISSGKQEELSPS